MIARAAIAAALLGCGSSSIPPSPPAPDAGRAGGPPPPGSRFDYQLGGAYPPPAGVTVVSRDHTASPAPGLYNICYVNGFQIQAADAATWKAEHPELILRDAAGAPVIDPDWGEVLIDIHTPALRSVLAKIVGAWIGGCRDAGFDAVEIDNLDSYTRSAGRLTPDNAVAMMHLLAGIAHAKELAIAQKNATDLVARRADLQTDFAIVEECAANDECDGYTAGYGGYVIDIEYDRAAFTDGCADYPRLSMVLRDRNVVTPDQPDYVFDTCSR